MDIREVKRLIELARQIVLLTNKKKLDSLDITLVHDYADMIMDALIYEEMKVIKKKSDLNIEINARTGGECCQFKCNGKQFYADKSCIGTCMETMIFPCDEEGNVTDWTELYADRSNKPLEVCIREFLKQL